MSTNISAIRLRTVFELMYCSVRTRCACSTPHLAATQTAYCEVQILIGGKQSKASQHVDHTANANIPKEVFRRLRSALSSLVNFRCRHRLREGQLRIFHHHTPHQRNEKHSEDAAHHD